MAVAFHTLDVFTDRLFGGNPLAVIPEADGLTDEQMGQVTREFNLSETAFVLPPRTAGAARRVRIFTPATELPFAGHPTVGTAVLLVALGIIPATGPVTNFVLEEQIGQIAVAVTNENGTAVAAQLTAAQLPRVWESDVTTNDVAAVLSLPASAIGTPQLEVMVASAGVPFLVVPLADPRMLSRVAFDAGEWQRRLAGAEHDNLYVVSPSGDGEVQARMFAPGLGVPEDPATGAAATALAGYLAQHTPDGPHHWVITQGVEMGRPSRLVVDADVVAGGATQVRVGGRAVRVSDGTLRVPLSGG